MWLTDKLLDMVRLTNDGYGYADDEEDGGYEEYYKDGRSSDRRASHPSSLSARQGFRRDTGKNGAREICLVKPSSFEDSADAARYLLAGGVVILDIKGAGAGAAQRVVDFICGTVYAMDGEIKSISAEIFIAAPAGVDLTGEFGDISGLTGLDSQSVVGNLKWMAAARMASGTQQRAFQAAV